MVLLVLYTIIDLNAVTGILQLKMAHPQTAFAPQQRMVSVFSALNILWLLHAALEGPVAFVALFFTRGLAFKDEITNTMAVIIKVCLPTL